MEGNKTTPSRVRAKLLTVFNGFHSKFSSEEISDTYLTFPSAVVRRDGPDPPDGGRGGGERGEVAVHPHHPPQPQETEEQDVIMYQQEGKYSSQTNGLLN